MIIGINTLTVSTYDLDSLTVSWEYGHVSPLLDLSTTLIDVQRSETDDFTTYHTVVSDLVAENNVEYTDTTLSGVITRRYNDMYYRLMVTNAESETIYSDIAWLTSTPNLRAKDIITRKNNALRMYGIDMYFCKRKTFGTICTSCYDEDLGQQTDGNCTTCYNTQFVGGYYTPISTKFMMTQTPDMNTVNMFGEFNPGQAIISTSSYPKLSVNDIVVDHLNRRWALVRVNNHSLEGYTVSQDAIATLIDRNDAIYDLEVS